MKIGSYGHVADRNRAKWVIYHNPDCSKSRDALYIFREKGIEPQIIEYLVTPPNKRELEEILVRLKVEAREIIRTKETGFAALGIDLNDRDQVLDAIVSNPRFLERPIVLGPDQAFIARPPEKLLEVL